MPPAPEQLLTQLETARNRFDPGHAAKIASLLSQLSKLHLTDPHHLVRFHECLLFLRAFPHAASQVSRVENLLNTFHRRVEKLGIHHPDLSAFDAFDTSGIAGTTMQDVLSFDVARWLVDRIPRNLEIAWDDYFDDHQGERNRANTWPRFIPLLDEDATVEADIPWLRWLDAALGRVSHFSRVLGARSGAIPRRHPDALPWLLARFAQLPLSAREKSELYDSLRLPIRWRLENLKFSRTRNWTRPRKFYFHDSPLIQRSEVSLAHELAQPAPKIERLSPAAAEQVINSLREFMAVRYRDLYGATLGDPRTVRRTHLGRGVIIHLWGIPPDNRLPLRAYVCGYTLKNGVAINYFEAIGLCEWLEVGFNTFYTFRQGETAWVYAQILRCLRAFTASTCFSIYPYQIGHDNDEALDSGAFWFYRKLGFRPGRSDLHEVCEREEKRIAANPQYRTPRRTLKRLAEAHMFYDLIGSQDEKKIASPGTNGKGTTFSRALLVGKLEPALAAAGFPGPWDTFSTRNLGLRINRRMAANFNSDPQKIRQAALTEITRALKINSIRWTHAELHSLKTWSLVLGEIPNLPEWSQQEKRQLTKIIRAKAAPNEMLYLRQTQRHARLRAELLCLGSQ